MTRTRLYANACDSTKIASDDKDGVDDDQDMVKAETTALVTKLEKFKNPKAPRPLSELVVKEFPAAIHRLDMFIRVLEEFGVARNEETLWHERSCRRG